MSCMQKYEIPEEPPLLNRDLIVDGPSLIAEEVEIATEEYTIEDQKIATDNDDVEMSMETKLDKHNNNGNKDRKIAQFNETDYKNGSVFENYCWSQSLKDVELIVLLPATVKSGKHIKVDFKTNHITIKSLVPKEEILINGETWKKYRHNDVVWTITDGKLIISFDKLKECWWDKLFVNESSIDIKSVDTERSISEFSPDTQNAIEKIQLQDCDSNEGKNFKTLPLSESEQMARLRQAWNAEGSPFKGQPFDPSIIKFN
ncbi:nudC domain-containing protein 3 isoform 2-T2 [Cochliomyia hominivorax]